MKKISKYLTRQKLRSIRCRTLSKKTVQYIRSRIVDDDMEVRREVLGCIIELVDSRPHEFGSFDLLEIILDRLYDTDREIIQCALDIVQTAFSQGSISRGKSQYVGQFLDIIETGNWMCAERYDHVILACGKIKSLIDGFEKAKVVAKKQILS